MGMNAWERSNAVVAEGPEANAKYAVSYGVQHTTQNVGHASGKGTGITQIGERK